MNVYFFAHYYYSNLMNYLSKMATDLLRY